MWYSIESWRKSSTASERENECNRPYKVRTLFWTKNSRTFKDTYTIFQALYLVKKEPWVCLFQLFHIITAGAILSWRSFCICSFKALQNCLVWNNVSMHRNHRNFQHQLQFSRTFKVRATLAPLQLVKLGTLRSDNGDANERSLKNRLRSLSNFLAPIPSHLVT